MEWTLTPAPLPPRVCNHIGCHTKLSTYNEDPFCWVHRHDGDDLDEFGNDLIDDVVLDVPEGFTNIEYTLHVLKTRDGWSERPLCLSRRQWSRCISDLRSQGYDIETRGGEFPGARLAE